MKNAIRNFAASALVSAFASLIGCSQATAQTQTDHLTVSEWRLVRVNNLASAIDSLKPLTAYPEYCEERAWDRFAVSSLIHQALQNAAPVEGIARYRGSVEMIRAILSAGNRCGEKRGRVQLAIDYMKGIAQMMLRDQQKEEISLVPQLQVQVKVIIQK